jgi:hypothetical protein
MTTQPERMQDVRERWSESRELPGLAGDIARRAAELWGDPLGWSATEAQRATEMLHVMLAGHCIAYESKTPRATRIALWIVPPRSSQLTY